MSDTKLDVLLTHGLAAEVIDQVRQVFSTVESAAASMSHHEASSCGRLGPQPCPWCPAGPLAGHAEAMAQAVNAWCAVGWFERGLLDTDAHQGDARVLPTARPNDD